MDSSPTPASTIPPPPLQSSTSNSENRISQITNHLTPSSATTTTKMSAVPSVRDSNKSEPYFPLAGQAQDGYSNADEATATCFCGAVQLAFPTEKPGMLFAFVCNCTDCRKITASMFASNFTVDNKYLKHLRGQDNLKTYSQSKTIESGKAMTNYFCQTCGSLMYRVSEIYPHLSILRLGTIDDFNLVETKLRPKVEVYTKDRVSWFHGVEGEDVKKFDGAMSMRSS